MKVPLQLRQICFYLSWRHAENENKVRFFFFFSIRSNTVLYYLVTLNTLHPEDRTNAYV